MTRVALITGAARGIGAATVRALAGLGWAVLAVDRAKDDPALPADQQRAVLDVNLGGVVNLARAAVPAMLRRETPRSGRFLAVTSVAATRGCRCWPPTARPKPGSPG